MSSIRGRQLVATSDRGHRTNSEGGLRVERGYARPEDQPQAEPAREVNAPESTDDERRPATNTTAIAAGSPLAAEAPREEDGLEPLPERLVIELTAHLTLALRDAPA
jgi:ParB family transcriptional regulator, chromosome partitioning protein